MPSLVPLYITVSVLSKGFDEKQVVQLSEKHVVITFHLKEH